MAFTAVQKELYDYCRNNEFISAETMENFRQKLDEEKNLHSLVHALEDFSPTTCPKCNASGAFKWHFLGKLTHPACSESWYVPSGTYSARQLKAVFRTGRDIGGNMALDAEKKGSKGIGEMFFGFLVGAAFRLPFAAMMIPVQAVVGLSQKKN